MENTDYFKQKLITLRNELATRIQAIDKDIRHEEMSGDWTEQATERENDEVLESLGNASENELALINTALKRIDAGTYFECASCGEPIPHARLESLPYATLCLHCAETANH